LIGHAANYNLTAPCYNVEQIGNLLDKKETTMPFRLGPLELSIILLIVIVLFGVGRLGKIGTDLGTAIREFRKGLQGDEKKDEKKEGESK